MQEKTIFICIFSARRERTFGGPRLREDRNYCFFLTYANLFERKKHSSKSKMRRYDLSV